MMGSNTRFTKLRCCCTSVGIFLYVADIGTDLWVAIRYFIDGYVAWCSLTLLFVLTGLACTQIFSYTWFCDDFAMVDPVNRLSRTSVVTVHFLQMGIFFRYYQLLREAVRTLWSRGPFTTERAELHRELFAKATDLSMLRLFEAFLESTPQLILQLYIILGHGHRSTLQYLCITGSFLSIAWATVDYRRCFRRSLPHIKEMPSGLPTAIYLLYKLCTVTARVLALSLLLVFSTYCTTVLVLIWLLGVMWTCVLQTDFCTSKAMEWVYRAAVGFILIFTFFNVKGQNAKGPMTVYYVLSALQNVLIPLIYVLLRPVAQKSEYFFPTYGVIGGSMFAGLLFLYIYYRYLHPRAEPQEADDVDGLKEAAMNQMVETQRMRTFLKY